MLGDGEAHVFGEFVLKGTTRPHSVIPGFEVLRIIERRQIRAVGVAFPGRFPTKEGATSHADVRVVIGTAQVAIGFRFDQRGDRDRQDVRDIGGFFVTQATAGEKLLQQNALTRRTGVECHDALSW